MVSELLYAGKTLADIASMDDVFLSKVLLLKRNKYGELARKSNELPEGVEVDDDGMRVVSNPVGYLDMYSQVRSEQGVPEVDIQSEINRIKESTPFFGG